ncbi:hypothetical protein PVK06_030748 [Gossypium arboreum]|uniref:Uncharacterized protein n=1 Tax=Gossypium arboreum TaxID=29729 RepID=A0ABR0NQ26_GOSAR|nr:hypothetical protein PVK06_030748 [Gossypium arboreum]
MGLHAYVGLHAQIGLAVWPHGLAQKPTHLTWPSLCGSTTTLWLPYDRVLRMTMPSSITQPCLSYGQPQGRPHARVALTK